MKDQNDNTPVFGTMNPGAVDELSAPGIVICSCYMHNNINTKKYNKHNFIMIKFCMWFKATLLFFFCPGSFNELIC